MADKPTCKHCRRVFIPDARIKDQKYCNRKKCQRARKTAWQRHKMATDTDYRKNQKDSQGQWRNNNPGYWKQYRKQHPQYCQRNRLQQKTRDIKRRFRHLAKMDALCETNPIIPGCYYIISATTALAKMDASVQKISIIPEPYVQFSASCKKGLNRPFDHIEIQSGRGGQYD